MAQTMKPTLAADERAVSAVIGVVLMVAITVVMSAVVYVLVSDLTKDSGPAAPTVAFQSDPDGTSYTLTKAPTGLTWSDFQVKGCDTVPTGDFTAGDRLTDCDGVTVIHKASNSVAYND